MSKWTQVSTKSKQRQQQQNAIRMCNACGLVQPRDAFSATAWRRTEGSRRCSACIAANRPLKNASAAVAAAVATAAAATTPLSSRGCMPDGEATSWPADSAEDRMHCRDLAAALEESQRQHQRESQAQPSSERKWPERRSGTEDEEEARLARELAAVLEESRKQANAEAAQRALDEQVEEEAARRATKMSLQDIAKRQEQDRSQQQRRQMARGDADDDRYLAASAFDEKRRNFHDHGGDHIEVELARVAAIRSLLKELRSIYQERAEQAHGMPLDAWVQASYAHSKATGRHRSPALRRVVFRDKLRMAAEDVLSKFLFEANRFASSTGSTDAFADALLPSWVHSAAAARQGELMGYMSRQLKAGFFGQLYQDLRRLKGGPKAEQREQATMDRSPWKHQTPTNHRTAAASTAVLDSGKKKKKKEKKEEKKESSGNKDEDHGADDGGDKPNKDSGDAEWVTVGGTRQVTAENAEEARDASGGAVDVDALLLQDSMRMAELCGTVELGKVMEVARWRRQEGPRTDKELGLKLKIEGEEVVIRYYRSNQDRAAKQAGQDPATPLQSPGSGGGSGGGGSGRGHNGKSRRGKGHNEKGANARPLLAQTVHESRLYRHKFEALRRRYLELDFDEAFLLQRIFMMEQRYFAISECKSSPQAALPEAFFRVLQSEFGVDTEIFASPLNRTLPRFCSLFVDVDKYFGSLGSAFDLFPDQGSFEMNPPFDFLSVKQALDQMKLIFQVAQDKADEIMRDAGGALDFEIKAAPLSFVVVINNEIHVPRHLENDYLVAKRVVRGEHHCYQMGLQHRKTCSCRGVGLGGKSAHEQGCTQSTTHWVPSQHMSSVMMIFQNQAGKEEWPVTETKLDALEKAWMPPEMAEGAS